MGLLCVEWNEGLKESSKRRKLFIKKKKRGDETKKIQTKRDRRHRRQALYETCRLSCRRKVNKEQVKPVRAGQMDLGQKVKQEMKKPKTNHRFERVLILLLSLIYIYFIRFIFSIANLIPFLLCVFLHDALWAVPNVLHKSNIITSLVIFSISNIVWYDLHWVYLHKCKLCYNSCAVSLLFTATPSFGEKNDI